MVEAWSPEQLSQASIMLAAGGTLLSSIGSFYDAKAASYLDKSAALDAEFAASMSSLNARAAELDAQATLAAGQREESIASMRTAAAKAELRAAGGASGTTLGVGSSAELLASVDYVGEVDRYSIGLNTVTAAAAQRTAATNFRTQASMQRVSAANLRASAGRRSATLAGATSLVGGATQVAARWARHRDTYG